MKLIAGLFGSTLGKKYIMALTGLGMVFFVTQHMAGNLLIFLGPEALNSYAAFLHSFGGLLWAARLGLLAAIILHIWSAFSLSAGNKAARPAGYGHARAPVGASLASRAMLGSGVIVAMFVVFHLLHYTVCVRAVNFTGVDFSRLEYTTRDGKVVHDVFAMVVYGFGVWYVALFYWIAVGCLSLHLSHGVSAMCQSLGLRTRALRKAVSNGAKIWAIVLFIGFSAVPAGVLAGLGKSHIEGVRAAGGPASGAAPPAPAGTSIHAAPAAEEAE